MEKSFLVYRSILKLEVSNEILTFYNPVNKKLHCE